MSSGVFKDPLFKDPWVQCNKCGDRRLWSQASFAGSDQGGTIAALRKILRRRGWQTAIPVRSGPRQDLCLKCRMNEGKNRP